MFSDGRKVGRASVALIAAPAELRPALVFGNEQTVAMLFGHHRRACNRRAVAIRFNPGDDTQGRTERRSQPVMTAIEKHRSGTHVDTLLMQRDEPTACGHAQRGDNAVLIDLTRLCLTDCDGSCPCPHQRLDFSAAGGAEQLAVAQSSGRGIHRRHDGAHAHRHDSGNGAPAHLINANDDRRTRGKKSLLYLQGRSDAHWARSTPLNTRG